MTSFVFVIIFGLSSSLLSCEGQIITSPGTKLTILPGSSENLTWNYVEDPSKFAGRSWFFTSTDGSYSDELIVQITKFAVNVDKTILPGIAITKPSTLSLNNVNQSYDGTYRFDLKIGTQEEDSSVRVYIAIAPIVTVSCPSPSEVNKGNNVIFVCRGVGGNPPANVTWYKDGVPISETKQENNTLNLYDVNGTDSGNYTCVAQNYPTEAFKDEKSCELIVRSKPFGTTITFSTQPAIGDSVEIMCDSKGFPIPHFNIIRNGEKIKIGKSHTLQVNQSDEGTYTCIAINTLGNDSATDNLTITDERPTKSPTKSPTKTQSTTPSSTSEVESTTFQPKLIATTTKTGKTSSNDASSKTEWYIVVVSLLSGIVIGILVSYVVWCSHRRWSRNKKQKRNSEPQTTEVDPTYQELDLTKMNKEDNYQSLTVNAASNDAANEDNSTYTQLTKTRDVESNYQSLT